jgi:hypothetical protein
MELNSDEIEVLENALHYKKANLINLRNGYELMDTDPTDKTMNYYLKTRLKDLDDYVGEIDGLLEKLKEGVI